MQIGLRGALIREPQDILTGTDAPSKTPEERRGPLGFLPPGCPHPEQQPFGGCGAILIAFSSTLGFSHA